MIYRIAAIAITAACRALLWIEKAAVRWITPELTPEEAEKYRGMIERHEREIGKKGGNHAKSI